MIIILERVIMMMVIMITKVWECFSKGGCGWRSFLSFIGTIAGINSFEECQARLMALKAAVSGTCSDNEHRM